MDYVIFLTLKSCFIGTWIVADTDIPPMERLVIRGVLELEDKHNVGAAESSYRKVVLNATYISLQVRLRVLLTFTLTSQVLKCWRFIEQTVRKHIQLM